MVPISIFPPGLFSPKWNKTSENGLWTVQVVQNTGTHGHLWGNKEVWEWESDKLWEEWEYLRTQEQRRGVETVGYKRDEKGRGYMREVKFDHAVKFERRRWLTHRVRYQRWISIRGGWEEAIAVHCEEAQWHFNLSKDVRGKERPVIRLHQRVMAEAKTSLESTAGREHFYL